jgi:hypothetical protein
MLIDITVLLNLMQVRNGMLVVQQHMKKKKGVGYSYLITKYKVAQAEVNQYKWEDKGGYNKICESKKSKQENSRNFTMIRH